MYDAFYGFREKPFSLLPDPAYLYLSAQHEKALALLELSLQNQAGFCVISGEIGAGKTTLIRKLLADVGDDYRVGLVTNTLNSFGDLMGHILMAFALEGANDSAVERHERFSDHVIAQYAQGRRTVLIIDEAQNIGVDALEELRMLSNINADKHQVLQIILVGQAGLRDILRRPELHQFAQRILLDFHLEPLTRADTANYIRHRLVVAGGDPALFTDAAAAAVYRYSGGIPRIINLLCDNALVYGFAEGSTVITDRLVNAVVRERQSNTVAPALEFAHAAPSLGEEALTAVDPVASAQAVTMVPMTRGDSENDAPAAQPEPPETAVTATQQPAVEPERPVRPGLEPAREQLDDDAWLRTLAESAVPAVAGEERTAAPAREAEATEAVATVVEPEPARQQRVVTATPARPKTGRGLAFAKVATLAALVLGAGAGGYWYVMSSGSHVLSTFLSGLKPVQQPTQAPPAEPVIPEAAPGVAVRQAPVAADAAADESSGEKPPLAAPAPKGVYAAQPEKKPRDTGPVSPEKTPLAVSIKPKAESQAPVPAETPPPAPAPVVADVPTRVESKPTAAVKAVVEAPATEPRRVIKPVAAETSPPVPDKPQVTRATTTVKPAPAGVAPPVVADVPEVAAPAPETAASISKAPTGKRVEPKRTGTVEGAIPAIVAEPAPVVADEAVIEAVTTPAGTEIAGVPEPRVTRVEQAPEAAVATAAEPDAAPTPEAFSADPCKTVAARYLSTCR